MSIVQDKWQLDSLPYSDEEKDRLQLLEEKQNNHTFEIAFCGHFSAGKSSLLNRLLGAELLPTSPIPTSANIIRVENGQLGLSVKSNDGKNKTWAGEIPWNEVRQWGMDGHNISEITIKADFPFLGANSSIVDTPGVDSTDRSHESVTVGKLYTTDAVVYVMDYNHVQSETNLYFLKQLSQERKPIYIVINQIDKHQETEIPFTTFRQSLNHVLKRWGIQYVKLFFTSMKQIDHPLNQYSSFEKEMKSLLYNSHEMIGSSHDALISSFYYAMENRLQEEKLEKVNHLKQQMESEGYSFNQLSEKEELEKQLHFIKNYQDDITDDFHHHIGKLFNNVTLFPFTTTDLTRQWIESLKPGFKVGILFSKKKTKEERENRLTRLIEDLQDKIKTQLLFHIQSYFQQVDRSTLTNKERFEKSVNELFYDVPKALLKSHVKTDYTNRDYVYTFTKEITEIISRDIKGKAKKTLEIQIDEMKEYMEEKQRTIEKQIEQLKKIYAYEEKLQLINQAYDTYIENIQTMLPTFSYSLFTKELSLITNKDFPTHTSNSLARMTLPSDGVIDTEWQVDESENIPDFSEDDTFQWITTVKGAIQSFTTNTLLSEERERLLSRIARYENQSFVISLFGAFSAGKSSFANALIGESILPVSPNPTTATINTVKKSDDNHAHRSAKISFKSREQLNEEIKTVSNQIDESFSIDSLLNWTPDKSKHQTSWEKTYVDYLLTLQKSIKHTPYTLGETITKDLKELDHYVTNEEVACLIQETTIYYDCDLTNKGIVLVDTPGVNSIHGRHTNVAFQQMKKSDAIFYLTYYNHAFSKADEYFLQQIGKVNESFAFDKLYFIINASDLAANENELNGVKKHVYDQLLRNGINSPRLYDLSSKQGLQAKNGMDQRSSSFSKFEAAFYQQTILELKALSYNMIVNQSEQYREKLDESIQFLNEDEAVKQKRYEEMQQIVKATTAEVKESSFDFVHRDLLQEFDQLTLYLRERMKFVLNDYFPAAINVATVNGNTKRELQTQLIGAMKEWKGLGEYFLKQELEATSVRLEAKMSERAVLWLNEEMRGIQKQIPTITLDHSDADFTKDLSLTMPNWKLNIQLENFTSYIKSKKDFFEGGTIKQLKEQLVQKGTDESSKLISHFAEAFTNNLDSVLVELENNLKNKLIHLLQHELKHSEALLDKQSQSLLEEELEQLYKYLL